MRKRGDEELLKLDEDTYLGAELSWDCSWDADAHMINL